MKKIEQMIVEKRNELARKLANLDVTLKKMPDSPLKKYIQERAAIHRKWLRETRHDNL